MSKINPDDPAMPMQDVPFEVHSPQKGNIRFSNDGREDFRVNVTGLTIRQELAARFFAAALSRTDTQPSERIALDAFKFADWFIEANNLREEQK